MTLEMALLFPVIFLTILGLIHVCTIHYQNMVSATAAMQAAARGASYWDKLGGVGAWDFQTEQEGEKVGKLVGRDYESLDPYRYILDGNVNMRIANTREYAQWLVNQTPYVGIGEEVYHTMQGERTGVLQKYVSVHVVKEYINPLEKHFSSVGILPVKEQVVEARAPMNTPGEFIRNITFFYDLAYGAGGVK